MSKGRTHRYVKFVLYLVLVVLLNMAAQSVFFRWDLTENGMYSLSPVSKNVVASLTEPLTIKAFFSKDLPPPYNKNRQYMSDLLQEYAQYSNQNFNYQLINVSPDNPEEQKMAEDYGIKPVQVQVVEEDSLSYKKVYMGAALIHGDAVEKLPTISSIQDLEYTLTSSMQNLKNKVSTLLNLKDPVQIKLIMSSSLKDIAPAIGLDGLPKLPDRIRSVVQDLNKENYGQLTYSVIAPKQNPELMSKASAYDLQELQWPAFEQAGIKAGDGVIGLVLEHGGKHRTLTLLNVVRLPLLGTQYSLAKISRIREQINLNLKSLLGINQSLGYLADHGTPSVNPMTRSRRPDGLSVRAFQQLVSKNYSLQDVTLDKGIPEGLKCLVIAGPEKKFSDYELYQIDQALMRGTNLAVFMDSFTNTSQSPRQPPKFEPNHTGLGKLLAHYGLKQEKSMVFDQNCYKQKMPQERGGGEQPIYFAPMIKNKHINHQLPYLSNIKGLVAFKNAPVRLRSKILDSDGLHGEILFSSSAKSWTKGEHLRLNPRSIFPPEDKDQMHSYPLAALVNGKFPSYFKGKPIPAQNATQENGSANATQPAGASLQLSSSVQAKGQRMDVSRPGKILLIGSASMISDTILDASGQGPNSVLIMNLIDALNGRMDMASLRSKVQAFNPLDEASSTVKTSIKAVNIVGLPLAVILFGLVVWAMRGSRKKRIQRTYS